MEKKIIIEIKDSNNDNIRVNIKFIPKFNFEKDKNSTLAKIFNNILNAIKKDSII